MTSQEQPTKKNLFANSYTMLCERDLYMPLNNSSAVVRSWRNKREWESDIGDFMRKTIKPDWVCLDVGAYIGLHTLTMSALCDQVIAFEPIPFIAKCLRKTKNLRQLENVSVVQSALGKTKGRVCFGSNHDGDSRDVKYSRRKWKNYYICDVLPLDEFNLPKVNFMKIDVEGGECELLEGAIKTIMEHRPIIIIEVLKSSKKNMAKFLKLCDTLKYSVSPIQNKENYLLLPL